MARKVMIVVHGMGEQRRNTVLMGLVRPLLQLMEARGDTQRLKAKKIDGDLSFAHPASVDITYGDQTWQIMEYWWAREFVPPPRGMALKWSGSKLIHHLYSIARSTFIGWCDVFRPEPGPQDPWVARIYHLVAAPIHFLMVVPLIFVVPVISFILLILPSVFLSRIPGVLGIVGWLQGRLEAFGVGSLGDIQLYFEDDVQSAQLRGGLRRLIEDLIRDDQVESILLYAHSTGAVVTYEALADLHESPTFCPTQDGQPCKISTYITVGSILNMAWNSGIVKRERFKRSFPKHIHWYNLWARYDPGPAGPYSPDPRNPKALAESKHWLKGVSLAEYRVNNVEHILGDHTTYNSNIEQVIALVLEELGGRNNRNDFWRGEVEKSEWWSRSEQTWKDFNTRRGTGAWLAFARLPALLIFPPSLLVFAVVFDWSTRFGAVLHGVVSSTAGWLAGAAQRLGISLWDVPSWTYYWYSEGLADAAPSLFQQLGMAAVNASCLLVLALGFYFLCKFTIWRWWSKRVRRNRHQEFIKWREDNRRESPQEAAVK